MFRRNTEKGQEHNSYDWNRMPKKEEHLSKQKKWEEDISSDRWSDWNLGEVKLGSSKYIETGIETVEKTIR